MRIVAGTFLCAAWLSSSLLAAPPPEAEFESSWLLVRLSVPLVERNPDGSFGLKTGSVALDALIHEAGIWRIEYALPVSMMTCRYPERLRRHGFDRVYKFFVPEGSGIRELVDRFSGVAGVDFAEPDYIVRLDATYPNDTRFSDQWNLDQASDADIDAPEAWDITTGSGVIVGMNDSGVDSDHEDLVGKILPGWDFVNNDADPEDDNGHGTRTSSVAMANTDNGAGIAGVCWNCRILPAKVFDAGGGGNESRSADGYVWLTDHGARIINQSGGSVFGGSQVLHDAVIYAYEAGVVMSAGAGNNNWPLVNYPARFPEVIGSGGTDQQDRRASFSNYGTGLDVSSPAVSILSAVRGGGYNGANGNSFAGPHVAGLAGLVETVYPSVGREGARHLIESGGEDEVGRATEDTPGYDQYHGWGRINADRTLRATQSEISLRVEGKSLTRVFLDTANPVADSYDFIRGDLSGFSETGAGVDIGDVICLENDSPDPDTAGGNEDADTPPTGEAFFYLSRFHAAPGAGQYGGSSQNRDRTPASGDCSL